LIWVQEGEGVPDNLEVVSHRGLSLIVVDGAEGYSQVLGEVVAVVVRVF
jgi:hypothetical protein